MIGWRAVIDARSSKHCLPLMVATINYLYLTIVILLLLSGYVLQYATCFRQDNLDAYDPVAVVDHRPKVLMVTPKLGSSLMPPTNSTVSSTFTQRATVNSTQEKEEDSSLTPELPTFPTVVQQQQSTKGVHQHHQPHHHHHRFNLRMLQPTSSSSPEEEVEPVVAFHVVPAHLQLLNSTRSLGARALERIGDSIRALRDRLTSRQSNISYHNSRDLRHHHETLLQCRGGKPKFKVQFRTQN